MKLDLRSREMFDLLGDATGVSLGEAGQPLELSRGQAERLPDVADGAAGVVGREAGHKSRVLGAVLLDHRDDQLLADVAREVEVDVGDGDELAVEEATQGEAGGDRVDVRKTGEEADDGADRASSSSPGRQEVAR